MDPPRRLLFSSTPNTREPPPPVGVRQVPGAGRREARGARPRGHAEGREAGGAAAAGEAARVETRRRAEPGAAAAGHDSSARVATAGRAGTAGVAARTRAAGAGSRVQAQDRVGWRGGDGPQWPARRHARTCGGDARGEVQAAEGRRRARPGRHEGWLRGARGQQRRRWELLWSTARRHASSHERASTDPR